MNHWREKEHIFFHLLKKRLLVCCNFFLYPTSQSCVISVMIEIRCWRVEEEEKYKVGRQSSRERAEGRRHEREQSQTRVELSVSQSAKSAWQPAGSPAIRRHTHSHTLHWAYCVRKSAINCHSENEFSETGSGTTRISPAVNSLNYL